MRFRFLIAAATTLSALTLPTAASGLVKPIVDQNMTGVVEELYRGGASREISGIGCGAQCTQLRATEGLVRPNTPKVQRLHRVGLALRTRIGLLPSLAGRTIPILGAGVFGYEIGSGLRKLWLGVQTPDPGTTTWTSVHAHVLSPGHLLYDGPSGQIRAPVLGLQAFDWYRGGWWKYYEHDREDCAGRQFPATRPEDRPIGGEWDILAGASFASTLYCGYIWIRHDEVAFKPLVTVRSDSAVPGPPEDYVAQPKQAEITWWRGQPESRAELESRLRTAFDTDEYDLFQDLLAHGLDPQNYPDPTTPEQSEEYHRCDVSRPAYENPGGNGTVADKYTPKTAVFETPQRPSGAEHPYLRFGETAWGGDFIDNWSGWGWRHIAAKHGWGPEDEAATRTTLASPSSTETSGTSMVYDGPEYVRNGVVCLRRVVVEFGEDASDPPGTPKGIITSYGRFVRHAP